MTGVKQTIQWMVRRPEREALLNPARRPTARQSIAKQSMKGACIDHVRTELNGRSLKRQWFKSKGRWAEDNGPVMNAAGNVWPLWSLSRMEPRSRNS